MARGSAQAQQAPLPGQFFDVPGIAGGATQWTEQDETTTNQLTTHNSAASVQVPGIQNFKQTDIVCDWQFALAVTQAYTAGTSTLTSSAYAPYNLIGATKLLIQNQYASLDVENGIDWYIFSIVRPYQDAPIVSGVNLGWNPAGDAVGSTALGYPTTAIAQANNLYTAQWATTATAFNLFLRIPAGQWFDKYYDLDVTGNAISAAHPAIVSPQYMAGTTRVIAPVIFIAPGNASTTDLGPVNIGTGTGTYTGSSISRFRRRAVYAGNLAVQPPVYSWQYRQKTTRFGIGGLSRADIQLPLDTGQLLFGYTRLFDPLAASGLGAPININTLTKWQLQYGSGLFFFDAQTIGSTTAAQLAQFRWFQNHSVLLPPGVLGIDLALDDRQQMTNARALNTLNTAGILFHMEFTAALSAAAYCTLGTESLVYVA